MDQAQYAFKKDTDYQIALLTGAVVAGRTSVCGQWALWLTDAQGNEFMIPYHAIAMVVQGAPPARPNRLAVPVNRPHR